MAKTLRNSNRRPTHPGEILREVGYSEEVIAHVQRLNLKKDFPGLKVPEARTAARPRVFLEPS